MNVVMLRRQYIVNIFFFSNLSGHTYLLRMSVEGIVSVLVIRRIR